MEKKNNLYELLDILNKSEESDDVLTNEDYIRIVGDLKEKVDAIKDFFSRCDAEADRLKNDYIKPIQTRIKQIEKQKESFNKWITATMKQYDMPLIHGDLFTLRLEERSDIEIDEVDITPTFYLEYKDMIKRSYAWDRNEVKRLFKSGKDFPFCREITKNNIKFTVIKKGK